MSKKNAKITGKKFLIINILPKENIYIFEISHDKLIKTKNNCFQLIP